MSGERYRLTWASSFYYSVQKFPVPRCPVPSTEMSRMFSTEMSWYRRAPPRTLVRLVKELILMLLIKINYSELFIYWYLMSFFKKKCHKMIGPPLCHLDQWLIFYWPKKKISGQPKASPHFRHWSDSII
jgi:hypothetical protein